MGEVSPVEVTGTGCVCAAGLTVPDCLAALDRGRRSPGEPSRFQNGHPRNYPVFEVPDSRFVSDNKERTLLSITVRFALHAAGEALVQAGLTRRDLETARVGVCLGTSVGASLNFLDFYRTRKNGTLPDMAPVHRYLNSNPALAVARELGTAGPIQTVVNACSSGADAIGMGASWIRQDLCDVVLAGGADELSEVTYNGFIRLMISDDSPCRPFDRTRRGLNLGEGAGIMVLESSAFASRRGRQGRGTILGYGTCADAHHLTAPHPEGRGLRAAVAEALGIAGMTPADVAFISAHGTGTPNNDIAEAAVFNDIFPGTPFVATKGMTGHTLGAAGAIEAIFTLEHLNRGAIPASAGFTEADPDLQTVPTTEPTTVTDPAALSQSLAFGGNNSVLVIGRRES